MKEIFLFHLANCPYCINARKAIEALKFENPAYRDIQIRWIEETQEPEMLKGRDYYYVPTIFYGDQKLYEAQPGQDYDTIKENVRRSFDTVLQS